MKLLSDDEFLGGSAAGGGTLLNDDEFLGAGEAPKPKDSGSSKIAEIGKGVAAGAVSTVASEIKGAAGQNAAMLQSRIDDAKARMRAMDLIDAGKPVPADFGDELLGTQGEVYLNASPEERKGLRESQQRVIATATDPGDVTQSPIFKAGAATQKWSDEQFKAAKDYEGTWTRAISEGLGSTVPFLLSRGGAGLALGSAASSGQQIDDAIAHGATKEQILEAVKLGGLPGLTEQLPIETLFERIPLPLYGKMASAIGKVLAQAAAEGGQEMLQQVAQNLIASYVYNPDQDITEGVLQAGAIGAIVGAGMKVVEPHTYKNESAAAPGAPLKGPNVPQGAASADTLFGQESAGEPPPSSADTAAGGPPPPPAASPEVDRPNSPRLTAEDRASPLPNNLIDDGKKIFEEALGGGKKQPTTAEDVAPLDGQIITPAQQRDAERRVADIAGEFGPPGSQAARPALEHTIDGVATGSEAPRAPAATPARVLSDREFIHGISAIDDAAHVAATSPLNDRSEPTQAMKEAGNYAKGHTTVGGLDVSIENPQGSERSGVDPSGKAWKQTLQSHYGYVKGSISSDGDHVDVFIKPGTPPDMADNSPVFVVNQTKEKGGFDETKTMLGFGSQQEADAAYHANYAKGWKGGGNIVPTTLGEFKGWLANGDTTKPFGAAAEPAKTNARAYMDTVKAAQATAADEAARSREIIDVPELIASSKPAGVNAVGEALYENQRGRFRVRKDRKDRPAGYPDFGGDLAQVAPKATASTKQRAAAAPTDIIQFLARSGGIQDFKGELRAIDAHKTFVPGAGKLMREKGMPLDRAREAAAQEGFFDAKYGDRDTASEKSTVADLLDLIAETRRGNRQYASGEQGTAAAPAKADRQQEEIEALAKEHGLQLTDKMTSEILDRMADGMAADEAIVDVIERESLAIEHETEDMKGQGEQSLGEDIPFDTGPAVATGKEPSDQGRDRQGSVEGAARAAAPQREQSRGAEQDGSQGEVSAEDRQLLSVFPEGYRFVEGRGPLGRGNWGVASPDKPLSAIWNYFPTKAQAARETRAVMDRDESRKVERDQQEKWEKSLAERMLGGEEPTDSAIQKLGLKPTAGFEWLSPVVQRLFGISKMRVREAMGSALRQSHSDMGAMYWVGNAKKALMNAAAWVNTQNAPKTETVETQDGKREQTVVPGAERISQKQQAQRGADEKMKPKAPQKDAGELFDAQARSERQDDMFSAKPKPQPTGKIDDFGEKIAGARKDMVRDLADSLSSDVDITAEPLSKVFPQPDYAKLAEAGVDTRALAFIAVARQQIPAKPRKGYKVARWAEQVRVLRGFANDLLSGRYDPDTVRQAIRRSAYIRNLSDTAEVISALDPATMPDAAKWSVKSGSFSTFMGYRGPPKTFYFLLDEKGRFVKSASGDMVSGTSLDEIIEPARAAISKALESKDAASPDRRTKLSIYQDRHVKTIFIGFKGQREVIRLKAGFETVKDARSYMEEHADELQATIDAMRAGPQMRRPENRPREGVDRREGDVSPEAFQETFGFRGVQFGNYVEGPRRQFELNEAFDGLMDLADVLAVPPQALSLNGTLGLAFGARGHGNAKAHYEPTHVVINLTKTQGAGSLAHEWFHSVDDYFSRQDTGMGSVGVNFMTTRADGVAGGAVRPPVREAFKAVHKALTGGGYSKRMNDLDASRSKPYWGTMIEKAARAFEKYTVDRLATQKATNDYLANIDENAGAYPTGAEMRDQGITAAFDGLFNAIETRPTERGVELFKLADQTQPTDAFKDQAQEIGTRLRAELDRLGLKDIGLRISENLGLMVDGKMHAADGSYFRKLITVALDAENPDGTLQHEALHALRALGLFSKDEWAILERISRKKWMAEHKIAEAYGSFSEAVQVEEGIAHAYGAWTRQAAGFDGIIIKAFRKIKSVLRAIARAFGSDFRSAEDVFASIQSGEIGNRPGDVSANPVSADGQPLFQAAWHGTPHDFDEFSLDKIGTGEGNQAYGWGLYFAGKKEIAEHYRKGLSYKQIVSDFREALPDDGDVADVMDLVGTGHFTSYQDRVLKALNADDWLGFDYPAQAITAAYRKLDEFDPSQELRDAIASSGRLYKVDLPEDSELMVWDAPLTEQPENVKVAVGPFIKDRLAMYEKYGQTVSAENEMASLTGEDLYQELSAEMGSDAAASEALRDAGIPGHKYLDGDSRADGDGTYNYVIYDDSRINVAERFKLRSEPKTAEDRQKTMQGMIARGQPLDRALRLPFQFLGGVDAKGRWKPGLYVTDKAAKIITTAKIDPEGRFGWLAGPVEAARAGLVDRYGLSPEYIERDRQRHMDERAITMRGAEVLKTLAEQNVGPNEARVLQAILTGEAVSDKDMQSLAEPIRQAIDELGQEAVTLGLISAESFERNRGSYLHRVYAKHEAEQNNLQKLVSQIMGSKRKKILGDTLKGRGLFWEVDSARLNGGNVAKGEKYRVLDKVSAADDGGKVTSRVYLPADQDVPSKYAGKEWRDNGIWEARQIGKGKVTLWRDYSQAERSKMGEILDARYTIGKTYIHMAHDLAVGRFYKDIAENEDWATASEPATKWVEADQRSRLVNDRETAWVKVPDTTISNTGGKKRWGALSGKWVRSEIWRDLNEIDIMNRPSTWRMLLSQWKLNKTARSPVTHMNNVMSNLMLMDMNDVRMQDLQAGLRSFVKKDQHWKDANEHGVFGADMMTQEIRDNVLKPILEEMEKQGQDGVQNSFLARAGILGKFADRLWSLAKTADRKMLDLYRIEDDVFRLASYRAGVARGETPEHAALAAREQFFDYDIRAPWVNAARNSLFPFISYTYRAVPLIARAMATRPWKVAKYAMVAYALNALAYAWDDDADEDKERASLRDEEQGKTWLFTPRMMRMPWRNKDGLPVFLDVRRWIPTGDIFDTNQGSSALPIPAPLQFGGPLMLAFELALNKSGFTGDPITNDLTDTWFDKTSKVGDYLWKSWLPSAAWVPNSWYWTKIENAAKGATDIKGRPYSLPEALASSVGVKLKPQDVETGIFWQYKDMKDVEQALRAEARALARQRDRGLISQKAFDSGMQTLLDKRDVLVEHVKELQRATRKK